MSEGYSKDWINKFYDPWYVKQKLNVRSMFDQLRGICKMQGDNSLVFLRNYTHIGAEVGCDRHTARRIVRKLSTDGKIKLTENNVGIEIFIVKYHYWQHVKKVGGGENPAKTQRKPNENSPLNKRREDKINKRKGKTKIPPEEIIKILNKFDEGWATYTEKFSHQQKAILRVHYQKCKDWVLSPDREKTFPSTIDGWLKFIDNWINREKGLRRKLDENIKQEDL